MPRTTILRNCSAALGASLAAHAVAVGALAWVTLAHIQPKLLKVPNTPFAGQQVAIALSFARPDIKVPPPPERPPVESPLLVTPDEARHEQRVYVDKTASELAAAAALIAPRVDVSELKAPRVPVAERENLRSVRPSAPAPSTMLARTPRERQPSTASVTVPPQTLGHSTRRPAKMQNNRPPRYPDIARQNRWEGTVLLKLTIDATGRVTAVEVARSSGFAILDAEAVTAVRQWQGEPATRDGAAIASEEYLPVRFRL